MTILFIVLAIVLCLVAILVANTVITKNKARKLTEFKPFYNDEEIEYYVTRLQKMC